MRKYSWLSLTCAALLASCGGGSSDGEDVGPAPGVQQYPGGVWSGTVGTGALQRQVFGYIDPGPTGTGGEFYLAREAASSAGYDGLYGRLSVDRTTVLATGVTYFSVRDGKFANNVTLRGTASASATTGRTNAISGNYSDPIATAAATGATTTLKLNYSDLNNHPARLSLMEGTYRGGGVFGGNWVLSITAQGALTGSVGACTVTGTVIPRASDSAVYGVSMNLSGNETLCAGAGTTQAGVAVLKFDVSATERSGIWMMTRNATGPANTFVLEGKADSPNNPTPAPTAQSAAGNWTGTVSGSGSTSVSAAVLPDGGYFFYRPIGAGYDALYGTLLVTPGSSLVSSNDGAYFNHQNPLATQYTESMVLSGDARTGVSFAGTYANPAQGSAATSFSMVPDTTFPYNALLSSSVARLAGTYSSPSIGFGGTSMSLTLNALGEIKGTTSNGCALTGVVSAYEGGGNNLYRVQNLAYTGGGCPFNSSPNQSGVASARFDAAGQTVTGLRVLTAARTLTGVRFQTIFIGTR